MVWLKGYLFPLLSFPSKKISPDFPKFLSFPFLWAQRKESDPKIICSLKSRLILTGKYCIVLGGKIHLLLWYGLGRSEDLFVVTMIFNVCFDVKNVAIPIVHSATG